MLYFLYYYIVIRLCIHRVIQALPPLCTGNFGDHHEQTQFLSLLLQIHSLENLMDSTWFNSLLQSSAVTNDEQFLKKWPLISTLSTGLVRNFKGKGMMMAPRSFIFFSCPSDLLNKQPAFCLQLRVKRGRS